MKSILSSLALATAAMGLGVVAAPAALAGPTYTGQTGNIAVSGYDAVSYFQGKGVPVKGKKQFSASYNGATYYFASAANAAKFKKNPTAYAPQYGGHCSWAMARGYLAPGDPTQYKIVDGKLYLNYNAEVQQTWLKDVPNYISSGNKNWPGFPDDAKFGG